MSVKFSQSEKFQMYYCTFTCVDWLPLFELVDFYEEIYNWFDLIGKSGNDIIGFVIMPNHLHILIHVKEQSINKILSNGKRFMAYEIVKRLKDSKNTDILNSLASKVTAKERERKKMHRVFEISSDIKPCYTKNFFLQKLNYIHNNPVSGRWNLATSSVDYFHSSAAFYELNMKHTNVNIIHYEDISTSVSSPAGDDTGH